MRRISLALVLLPWAKHQQHGAEASSRSAESAYDTNKSVFSPQGRLVQLDYVEGIVKRGNLCIGAECKDGVVLVTNKLMSADAAKLVDDRSVRRIYRVDSHIGILPAGLPADGRALAHKAMEYCRSHRREYGEPIPGRALAEHLGEFMHAACVRWGSRAYPNSLYVACWEEGATAARVSGDDEGDDRSGAGNDNDDGNHDEASSPTGTGVGEHGGDEVTDEEEEGRGGRELEETQRDDGFQLYVVDPNGAARRYRAACTGRGSTRARKWLHRRSEVSARRSTEGGEGRYSSSPLDKLAEDRGEGGVADIAVDGLTDDDDTIRRRRHNSSKKRGDRRPLSQMTCADAARVIVREAERVGGGGDGGAGGGGGRGRLG